MDAIDPEQLGQWFDAHGASLTLYARQFLDDAAAEDVVQEVFLRLMNQRREPANVKAWLYVAVRNAAISATRSHHRRRQREQHAAANRREWFISDAEANLDAAFAQTALADLPGQQREVVVLRIWGQMTYAEIARITSLPVSSVHDQYRFALEAIRKRMESPCRKNSS